MATISPPSPTYASKYSEEPSQDTEQDPMEMSMDEELLFGGIEDCAANSSPEDQRFDTIVGCLEEVLMNPEFQLGQDAFCEEHCHKFFNDEENRLEYMPLFQEYSTLIETFIADSLTQHIEGFSMDEFQEMLETRSNEICGDIFDLLLGLSDFQEFKDTMLSYKAAASGKMFKSLGGEEGQEGTSGVGFGGAFSMVSF